MFRRLVFITVLSIFAIFESYGSTGYENFKVDVAWQQFDQGYSKILLSIFREGRWNDAFTVYESDQQLSSVSLTTLNGQKKILFWSEKLRSKRQIYYREIDMVNAEVSELGEVRILTTSCDFCLATFPIIEQDGGLRLFWSDTKNGLDDIFTSRFYGGSWSEPEQVNQSNDVPDILPLAELDPSGLTTVRWKSYSRIAQRYLTAQRKYGVESKGSEIKQDFTDKTINEIPRPSNLPYNSRLFYHLPDNQLRQNIPVK